MRDYMELSTVPYDEDCAQVGTLEYGERSRKECRAYINQLKRMFPQLNQDDYPVTLSVKKCPHDFGTYREVVVYWNDSSDAQTDLVFEIEGGLPARWDEEARQELGLN